MLDILQAEVDCIRSAAEQGDAEAQLNLGICFAIGDGVNKNREHAAKWYRKSAEQGNPEAQYCLGACYSNGDGVTEDAEESMKWLQKAADQGYEKARVMLAFLKAC